MISDTIELYDNKQHKKVNERYLKKSFIRKSHKVTENDLFENPMTRKTNIFRKELFYSNSQSCSSNSDSCVA